MDLRNCAHYREYLEQYDEKDNKGFCIFFEQTCLGLCYAYKPIKQLDDTELREIKITLKIIKEKIANLEKLLNEYQK